MERDQSFWISRDDAKKFIFFLMLNAGHPVCRSPIPFNQVYDISSKSIKKDPFYT
jgi:hypothetical protein